MCPRFPIPPARIEAAPPGIGRLPRCREGTWEDNGLYEGRYNRAFPRLFHTSARPVCELEDSRPIQGRTALLLEKFPEQVARGGGGTAGLPALPKRTAAGCPRALCWRTRRFPGPGRAYRAAHKVNARRTAKALRRTFPQFTALSLGLRPPPPGLPRPPSAGDSVHGGKR